jgi:hypothetical protein
LHDHRDRYHSPSSSMNLFLKLLTQIKVIKTHNKGNSNTATTTNAVEITKAIGKETIPIKMCLQYLTNLLSLVGTDSFGI